MDLSSLERRRGDLGLRVSEGDASAVDELGRVEDQIDQIRRQNERREAIARARARRDGAVHARERERLIGELRAFLPDLEREYSVALAALDRLPRGDRAPWSLLELAYLSGRRLYAAQHDLWGSLGADLRTKPVWFVPNDLGARNGESFVMARASAPPRIVKQWQSILDQLDHLPALPETSPAA